jgi:L,D-transpeptidase catalytic domain
VRVRRIHILQVAACLLLAGVLLRVFAPGVLAPLVQRMKGQRTVALRVAEFGEVVRARLAPDFARIGLNYPPKQVVLVGLKQERLLEVWVAGEGLGYRLLMTYPILGASGKLGPKLREGDLQVPEGLYRIESLNPNSAFHLSLRLDYPNDFDREKAERDGRASLGGDIMIHGGSASIGCLAMGDGAAEDLFVLAAETGIENVSVILSPVDLRVREAPEPKPWDLDWIPELHDMIRAELLRLREN